MDEQQHTSITIASEFLEEIAMAPNISIQQQVITRPLILRPSLSVNPVYSNPSAPVVL
jgi:hypothetical protein